MKINYVGKCLLLEENGERVLVIGDLHLGYEGAMRASGVMIPVKLYEKCIADFEEIYNYIINNLYGKIIDSKNQKIDAPPPTKVGGLIGARFLDDRRSDHTLKSVVLGRNDRHNRLVHGRKTGEIGNKLSMEIKGEGEEIRDEENKIDKIIILGDVKHEFGLILQDEWNKIKRFLEHLRGKCKEIVVIEGNHDTVLFPILQKMGIEGVDYYLWKEFVFIHGDKNFKEIEGKEIKYWVLGHGHPAVNLYEGVKRESYKCFLTGSYRGKKVILVPSFFPLIAGTDAREFDLTYAWKFNLSNFDVRVVSEGLKVFDFGKLKDIK